MPLSDVPVIGAAPIPRGELSVDFVRSSGPGGQHVNTSSTQAQLRWSPAQSTTLSDAHRERLLSKLSHRLTGEGEVLICCDRHRSRERNLQECLTRLGKLVSDGIQVPKKRRPTRRTKGSQQRRLDQKKRRSETKRLRRSLD